MASRKKVLIILGTPYKKRLKKPRPLLKARLDYAIGQLQEEEYVKVFLCGGHTQKYRNKQLPSEAEIMKQYLLQQGISRRMIVKEQQSTNTIGNLAYVKRIIQKYGYKDLTIITNEIFTERVRYLGERIFGKSYRITVKGAPNRMSAHFRRWIHFSESFWLGYCYAYFFRGVKRGDHKELIRRLHKKEEYYPEGYKEDYAKLKEKYFRLTRRKVKSE
jgi:uncharacterized SAM-binding protein YcdF (DUF218 family)